MSTYCSSCGTPLPAGTTRCPTCGAPLGAESVSTASYYDNEETPYSESMPYREASSSSPARENTRATGAYHQYIGAYPPSTPPAAPYPVQPQRRFPTTVVLLIVLIIAIVVGSGLLYYGLKHPAPSQTQTKTASPTAVSHHATPLTGGSPQALYRQVMSRIPTINGALGNQNLYQWMAEPSNASCTPNGSTLHVTLSSGNSAFCLAQNTNFSNFAFQVQTAITQGDIGGIAFRTNVINRSLVFFGFGINNSYEVMSVVAMSSGKINGQVLGSGTSPAIKVGQGQTNTLTIIAIGKTVDLYANGQFVSTVQDTLSPSGALGLLGGNDQQNGFDVAYTNARIWDLTQ